MRYTLPLLLLLALFAFSPTAWANDLPPGATPTAPVPSPAPSAPAIVPTIGRLVLVTIEGRDGKPVVRPGVVLAVWGPYCINAAVFIDGLNDDESFNGGGIRWETSISHNDDAGVIRSWRWMPVQAAGGGFDARISQLEAALKTLAGENYRAHGDITTLETRMGALESLVAKLNAKQPATQRVAEDGGTASGG